MAAAAPPASDGRASPIGPWTALGWAATGRPGVAKPACRERTAGRASKTSARVHAAPVICVEADTPRLWPIELPLREGHALERERERERWELVHRLPCGQLERDGPVVFHHFSPAPGPTYSALANELEPGPETRFLCRAKIRARGTVGPSLLHVHANHLPTGLGETWAMSMDGHGRAWDAMRCDRMWSQHSAPCKTPGYLCTLLHAALPTCLLCISIPDPRS